MVMRGVLKILEGFHHQASRRISVMMAQCIMRGEWEWPSVSDALKTSGLWTIKEYIHRRQATILAHLDCRTIYEMCTGEERMTGDTMFLRWWYQEVVQEVA